MIEIDDTVRTAGRRGTGIVTDIDPVTGRIEITYTTRINYSTTRTDTGSYAPTRVTLARKGNAVTDACNAVLADLDRREAERAAADGMTVAEYRAAGHAKVVAEAARRRASIEAAETARAARYAAAEAAAIAEAARAEADAERRRPLTAIEAAAASAENDAHAARHGGDFIAALMCGVESTTCTA